ncbi:MAG TPA: carboxypeptidase-like regulatory domain-containing protein [bacterium]
MPLVFDMKCADSAKSAVAVLLAGLVFTLLIAADHGSIKGFVKDASNGEKLSYANVYIENTSIGTSTDEKGYYYIPAVPAGSCRLIISYLGYETDHHDITVNPGDVITINAELVPTTIQVQGVTATAERDRFEKDVEVSHVTFTKREIKSVPMMFESDLIKVIQLMPGVVTMHDLSNKMYVRGGSPDENLVLLDGIIVYNPSTHLGGLFSTFNPDAVSEAELYAGGFPAQYGDRLSAVLDIETKEGNSKEYTGEASMGLVTSKIMVEGPIPKGSILLSGRRTYFDAIVWAYDKLFSKDVSLPYYFYDGVGKLNFNLSNEDRFTLTGFGGADVLGLEEEFDTSEKIDLSWGNRGASLRYRKVLTPKLYGEFIGVWSNFFTHFRYTDYADTTNNMHLFEELISYNGKGDFTFLMNDRNTLGFGLQAENLKIDHYWEVEEGLFTWPSEKSNLIAAYVQDKIEWVPPLLFVQPGVRFIYYDKGRRLCFDPRIGVKYRYGENTAFNLAVGKYSQFLVTVNTQESYFSLFDFWQPVDATHDPPFSVHAITGIEQWFDKQTKFTVECYGKKYYNLLIPSEDDVFFSMPAESLRVGNGYALGVDVFLKKSIGMLSGWISYSLGWTRRTVDNESYFPRYDRRHSVNTVIGSQVPRIVPFFRGGTISLRWNISSGLPYADDIARYHYWYYSPNDEFPHREWEWRYIKGRRDAFRLPMSHRLDAHYEKNVRFFGLTGQWYIDVINVYAQKNVLFFDWEYYDEQTDQYLDIPRKKGYSILPVPIPSVGFSFKF